MKAAIIGHGKMGREIEKILLERGHRIGAVIDEANASELDAAHLAGIDVALEFTTPDAAYGNIRACIDARDSGRQRHDGLDKSSGGVAQLLPGKRRCALLRLELLPGRQPDVPPQPQAGPDDGALRRPTTYGSKRFTTHRKRMLRAARPSRWQKGSSAKSGGRRAG